MFKGQEYKEHILDFVQERALETDPEQAVRVFGIDDDETLIDGPAWCHGGALEALEKNEKQRFRKTKAHPYAAYLSGDALVRRIEYHNDRARRRGQPGTLTVQQWLRCVSAYQSRCAYCDASECSLDIEHVIPISKGGGTEISNIVPACGRCNGSKNGRTPEDWKEGAKYIEAFEARRRHVNCYLKLETP